MLTLTNGHQFKYVVSSGALGYDGQGYWWERPLVKLGVIDPKQFTVITKTLTYYPRVGNLKWWCPWRAVRLIPGGTVNSVGLTNPGIHAWVDTYYPKTQKSQQKIIVSIAPENPHQAQAMGALLETLNDLVGIELNVSCPNSKQQNTAQTTLDILWGLKTETRHPIILKLGAQSPLQEICKLTAGSVEAWDIINTVSWATLYPDQKSPIERGPIGPGGVSGLPILNYAREALTLIKQLRYKTGIISGGGIYSAEEANLRFLMGADAVSFGTLFLRKPWAPNRIIRALETDPKYNSQLPLVEVPASQSSDTGI